MKSSKSKALEAKGFDGKKRWGNSAMKGHGVNSPAMMEAREKAKGGKSEHRGYQNMMAKDRKQLKAMGLTRKDLPS